MISFGLGEVLIADEPIRNWRLGRLWRRDGGVGVVSRLEMKVLLEGLDLRAILIASVAIRGATREGVCGWLVFPSVLPPGIPVSKINK